MVIVTFQDPVVNQEISYYLDPILKPKWEVLRKKVIKYNNDRVYIVVGKEGAGKSFWTFQQAKFIDPTFNIDRICFTPKEFLDTITNCPEGSVVVFDEAFRGFSSKSACSRINKALVQAMMEVRRRNLIIFIVLPAFPLLEPYIAIHRSRALFYIFDRREKSYRGWKCYNLRKKIYLYYQSKKNYGILPPSFTKTRGKFFCPKKEINNKKIYVPYETFPMIEYDNKKGKAFSSQTTEQKIVDNSKQELKVMKYRLSHINTPIMTQKDYCEQIKIPLETFKSWRKLQDEPEDPEKEPEIPN